MSAENIWMTAFLPDKKVELVKKIIDKTKQGKIVWQRTGQGVAAQPFGRLKMNFVETPSVSLIGEGRRWVIFAVRDDEGNEVLKVENKASAVSSGEPSGSLATLNALLGASDPLVGAVTELHNVVRTNAKGDIDKIINLLDGL